MYILQEGCLIECGLPPNYIIIIYTAYLTPCSSNFFIRSSDLMAFSMFACRACMLHLCMVLSSGALSDALAKTADNGSADSPSATNAFHMEIMCFFT